MKAGFFRILGPILGGILFVLAFWVLHRELNDYHLQDIINSMHALPVQSLLRAVVLTFISYAIMTVYDVLALKYIRHPLEYKRIALASFIGYAFSNNIGLSMLAGASIRYRLYSVWGLSGIEILKVIVFCTVTLWLGFLSLSGLVFIFEPLSIPKALHLPFVSGHPLGMIFLLAVGLYLVLTVVRKTPVTVHELEFDLPSVRLFLPQIIVASLDWALAGSVLYVLLKGYLTLSFTGFISIYLLAQLVSLVSQIPGGLGVFEAVMLIFLGPLMPSAAILASLVVFRGMYYLLPLSLAAILLGVQEVLQRRELIQKRAIDLARLAPFVVPNVLAMTTFVGGVILLFSGATPADHSRLAWLKDFLPLPVVEGSHFLGSLAGVGLLILARGIQRRIDAAYLLTTALLGLGIVSSLLKGFDYEEALVLSVMLLTLIPCRKCFYRKASLLSGRLSWGWVAAVSIAIFSTVWLTSFSFKHVEYSSDLWWHFALTANAPRSLRAIVGIIIIVLWYTVAKLLRPALVEPEIGLAENLEKAGRIIQQSTNTYANLALLGDKAFVFNQKANCFIMYNIEGRSWVAMGDPIGPQEEWPELIWQYRELCDRYGGWPVFYEVGSENLPVYIDLGLTLLKLGEEGRVDLTAFSLEGSSRKDLRYTNNKLAKEGCHFELIHVDEISGILPELSTISDAWLEEKNTSEKGFSLGFFKEDYLKRFPAGIVRQNDRIVAFANIWTSGDNEELSVDLMRYLPEAPNGVMDYLFVHIMLWGKQRGCHWFNLGMAPLSGLEDRSLATLWNRIGALLFNHAEHFYNFQGLRLYKEKFNPVWNPRYLASPATLALPMIITNIATLTSGGLKGIIAK